MKRFISIISVFILLCSLTGCAQLTHHTPKATVNHFFKSLKTYDTEQLAQYLTVFPDAKDTDKTYDPFSDKPYVELYQKAYVDLSYEIVSITQNGDSNATVVVKVKHPDLKSAYSTAFYASAAMIFSNEELLSSLF
ncbi:MAG: DUF4878 domain-containing protein, partial [Clostridia bacterium]|nr:DUF4878 domain-containing protein [Clostridia bacterium]